MVTNSAIAQNLMEQCQSLMGESLPLRDFEFDFEKIIRTVTVSATAAGSRRLGDQNLVLPLMESWL